ncbi:MAG TPA: UDP-N-acetylglucosamine 2-epimerase (non-hydrolyzing) [Candidatus Rifleibacterium sp.]|nr:UDP-N-acetylglucosamine 2-epimerase (non-hydrolyzing) [Candidatus Rifleibacterium sp.]HPT47952.1 UDP-N-acetylglucosamine 2-epimerase (non-hydrolyzing) [Candidatus Rifleibacterium sp.]
MSKLRFLFILGTRPEVIKMAPVIFAARETREIESQILHTGQHLELAAEMFHHFRLRPDFDLGVMQPEQTLFQLTSRITEGIGEIVSRNSYDMIFVQGDTSSAFLGALCAFYRKIPVGHIEAGLRTNDRYSPFPEEMNRRLVSPLASLHFAPTTRARDMLTGEGIAADRVEVTGNTVIDALFWSLQQDYPVREDIKTILDAPGRLLLVTTHRRENFGEPHRQVFSALLELVERFPDTRVLFPIHPNPNVRREAAAMLNNHPRVHLTSPLDYQSFIRAMQQSFLILSDSGGVQEEAPSLNKPVLVLRESTERPEGLATGAMKLVGTDRTLILREATSLLTNEETYQRMAGAANPYGDGKASQRIIAAARRLLSN